MPPDKRAYVRELNAIAKRYGNLEDDTIRDMVGLLRELRVHITAEVGMLTDWSTFRLQQATANIDRMIAQFEGQLNTRLQGSFTGAYQNGAASAVDPFRKAGIANVFFQPTTSQLNVIVNYSARLVRQITEQMRAKIDTQLRLAVLGGKSPLDAMKAINVQFGISERGTGRQIVGGVGYNAERVVRTEMGRAFNLATYSQAEDAASTIPGLTKSWVATADARTRTSHLEAHRRYMDPIPVDEPFSVGGAELWFPGDPSGPPEETINCRCRMITQHPAIGRVGTALDGRIENELDQRGVILSAQAEEPGQAERTASQQEHDLASEIAETRTYLEGTHDESVRDYLNTLEQNLRDEQEINEALWKRTGKLPEEATPDEWARVAAELQRQGERLYEKYTKEGITQYVAQMRGAKDSGYAQVGGQTVMVQRGHFSVAEGQRMEGELWQEAKPELSVAAGELLQQVGYRPGDYAGASYEQRMQLLREAGQKELTTSESGRPRKIDDVPVESRQRVVRDVDYDLAATCATSADDPLGMPTIDAYRKFALADMIRQSKMEAGWQESRMRLPRR